ncbi:MAG: single-stranded-DNA-specific exonuclease RecJ [Armatimonadota bacterium]|nr:single-stranded-DNA-specific exonuclease RecJ [Armatimonadota bacterium]
MDNAEWNVVECDEALAVRLAAEAGIPAVVARLLVNRGITTVAEAYTFLNPSLDHLHDPFLLPDLDAAVDRLVRAVRSREKICVHGDYDVDGVTATALLVRVLRALNADVEYHIPNRLCDGYGLKPEAIIEIARRGSRVVVTCDCGITAWEAAEAARYNNIDLVITDHHEPGDRLPKATAVINPKRRDAAYPFPELAGVGVAFKLAQGLVRALDYDEDLFTQRFTDLAALGTVSDVVPLLGENRSIVKHGLEVLPDTKKVGLRTMIKCAGLENKPLTAHYLAFILGPRINAAGRMHDASTALKLLLTREEEEAEDLVQRIEGYNNQRRAEQERVFNEAVRQAEIKSNAGKSVLVVSGAGWNRGVIGIVAARICELFNRPTIVISRDERRGIGSGSARSIPEFNLIQALHSCSDLLIKYGGHALAAGITLHLSDIDQFEDRVNAAALEVLRVEELVPRIDIEAEVSPTELTVDLARTIESMEPFGNANPEPLLLTNRLKIADLRRVGDGSHIKLQLYGLGGPPLDCIGFGLGDLAAELAVGDLVDVCYSIRVDDYRDADGIQLVLKGVRLSRSS